MMRRLSLAGLAIATLAALIVASMTFFVVDQTHQAIILHYGQPVRDVREPGLGVMIPFWQNVIFFDRRLLDLDPPHEEVILADQKRLVVDSYARYRITDPLKFYQSMGSEDAVRQRLGATINGSLRRVLGNELLSSLLSPERSRIMTTIREEVAETASGFGIEVIDVRIRRADLPQANSEAIFRRMQSERQREAAEYRAEGAQAAQTIKAEAEREATVIRAEAQRQAQGLRGEGDAQSIAISAGAFGKDPEFYAFYRSLDAYRTALGPDTTLVLSPDSDFFRYLQHRPVIGR